MHPIINVTFSSIFLFFLVGCSSSQKGNVGKALTPQNVAKIQLQISKEALIKEFGQADNKLAATVKGEYQELWIYRDKTTGFQRASFKFDKHGSLISKGIQLNGNDMENQLDRVKKTYGVDTFASVEEPQCHPHVNPDAVFYYDNSAGIVATYSKRLGRVTALGWSPTHDRTLTSVRPDVSCSTVMAKEI